MEIEFTKHACDMLKERKLSREIVESAVREPDWREQKDKKIWHAFKRIENKILRVVVKGEKEPSIQLLQCFLIGG